MLSDIEGEYIELVLIDVVGFISNIVLIDVNVARITQWGPLLGGRSPQLATSE